MPKKRKQPETFDEFIGAVIDSKRALGGISQEDLATAAHIPLTNLGRSIRGTRPLSISEFERIADRIGQDAGAMAAEALRLYGGIEKLLAETAPVSEDSHTVGDDDNVTYLGRITPPLTAAADDGPRAPGHN